MKLNYKRFLKIFAFGIGILAMLSFAASYGFNYWLKNNLPEIIKKILLIILHTSTWM
ncbi:hypothetical protein ACH34F_09835 [Elizabethkingia anophelis]|uniref:hypothetical protein n=1 Tax=Elizabethkingia anophelis TaxID=1117645 RepID=UPI003786FA80